MDEALNILMQRINRIPEDCPSPNGDLKEYLREVVEYWREVVKVVFSEKTKYWELIKNDEVEKNTGGTKNTREGLFHVRIIRPELEPAGRVFLVFAIDFSMEDETYHLKAGAHFKREPSGASDREFDLRDIKNSMEIKEKLLGLVRAAFSYTPPDKSQDSSNL